jgi:hypothetical protein
LIAIAFPAAIDSGVAAVQVYTEHVQKRFVPFQNHALQLLPFAVPGPFAEMSEHGFVMQLKIDETGGMCRWWPVLSLYEDALDDLQ